MCLDPSKRLDHFQSVKEKLEKELLRMELRENGGHHHSGEHNTLIAKRKNIAIPTVYEWDIHPGEVSKKLLPQSREKQASQKVDYIGITGKFLASESLESALRAPGKETTDDSSYQPNVTLLINNYVKSKVLPRQGSIDPNTIHRVPSRQDQQKGKGISSSKSITLIKSNIPEYGKYDLKRNKPLPNIVKSNLLVKR